MLQELHQLVFQRVMSGVRVLADMSRRVCSSSSERTGAGKMRFFALRVAVVENWRVVARVVGARSRRWAMVVDFIIILIVDCKVGLPLCSCMRNG